MSIGSRDSSTPTPAASTGRTAQRAALPLASVMAAPSSRGRFSVPVVVVRALAFQS